MAKLIDVEGVGRLSFPDETPDAVIDKAVKREVIRASIDKENKAREDALVPKNPIAKLGLGFGAGITDAVLAGKQMYAGVTGNEQRQRELEQEAEEKRRNDARLGGWGTAGKVAAAIPLAFVPGAGELEGAAAIGMASGALMPTVEGESRLKNAAVGGAFGGAGQVAGRVLGSVSGAAKATALATKTDNEVRDQTLREALKAGYVVPPSTTNPTVGNVVLESIGGKAQTASRASSLNQKVTDSLIRKDLGMAADAPLIASTLKGVRTEAGKIYGQIAKAGKITADDEYLAGLKEIVPEANPLLGSDDVAKDVANMVETLARPEFDANAALGAVKKLRQMGRANTSALAAADPSKAALGRAQLEAAEVVEDQIDRHLRKIGAGHVADAFDAARTTIAKSHSVEKAINESAGHVDATKLAQQLRRGKPMTGGLGTVARTAAAFPQAMRHIVDSGGVRALDAVIGGGGAVLGHPAALAVIPARMAARELALKAASAIPKYNAGRLTRAASKLSLPAGLGATRLPPHEDPNERLRRFSQQVQAVAGHPEAMDHWNPTPEQLIAALKKLPKRSEGPVTAEQINKLLGDF